MQVPDILKNKWFQVASASIVAFAAGSGGGYILGKKKATVYITVAPKPEQMSIFDVTEQDIDEMKDHLKELVPDPKLERLLDKKSLDDRIDEEEAFIKGRNDTPLHIPLEAGPDGRINYSAQFEETDEMDHIDRMVEAQHKDTTPVSVNVFESRDDDGQWVWEDEIQVRQPHMPYVIHYEEYINGEMGFKQETLTYYQGDDIMADPADTPIYDYAGLMGNLKFGHGSRDANVVYIRNEKIRMEWEVLLHTGLFSVEVLGQNMEEEIEQELRHSSAVMKFRRGD